MLRWAWMLGGLLVWTAHFCGVYGLASLADVVATADDLGWRMAALGFSAVCVAVCAVLLGLALRRRRSGSDRFGDDIAALSAVIGSIAIVWQAAPTLIGY